MWCYHHEVLYRNDARPQAKLGFLPVLVVACCTALQPNLTGFSSLGDRLVWSLASLALQDGTSGTS